MIMAKELKLPDIGEGIQEGEIIRWIAKEGQRVKEYEPVVEIMTEKVNVEIPSPTTGTIIKILAKEGQVVKVGAPIALIQTEGEAPAEEQPPQPEARVEAVQKPAAVQKTKVEELEILATPAVRKLARDLGVELGAVIGTGPGGRVTEEDIRGYAARGPQMKMEAPPALVEKVQLRGVRRKIAERLTKSKNVEVHVTHFDEVDVTSLVSLRETTRETSQRSNVKMTYLPFIIKALAKALKQYPHLNATYNEAREEFEVKGYYNIGIATDTDYGLVVPVVKSVDKKDIYQLAAEIDSLAEKARNQKLSLQDVQDGTFTITNIGPIGGTMGTPIINYPEVAILGVHKITKRPVVKEAQIVIREMMNLSLSFDHRLIDGALAANFVNALKKYLEEPAWIVTS